MDDYLILVDSSCDISDEMKQDIPLEVIPINLTIDDEEFVDDGSIDLEEFLKKMANSRYGPKTSAPAPNLFMQHFNKADNIFIICISKEISSSYNNAMIAKQMYLEDHPEKQIEVIDSRSASVALALLAMKLNQKLKNDTPATQAANEVREYAHNLTTLFVLNDLSNLLKSGRITHISSLFASILKIKPLMGSDGKGGIGLVKKVRGYKHAVNEMLDSIGETPITDLKEKVLGIAYCKAPEEAKEFANKVKERYPFMKVHITAMRATISVYANIKGLLIAY
jgi:DegV family protein with EDD domain